MVCCDLQVECRGMLGVEIAAIDATTFRLTCLSRCRDVLSDIESYSQTRGNHHCATRGVSDLMDECQPKPLFVAI